MTEDRLFTPRFWLMCGVSFTAFLAAFQLYPTAPFRILALGGTETAAGMFLGLMTYASALSALFTGALADQIGKRRMLVACSGAAAACSVAYAFIASVPLMLLVVVVHGIFWSGLMTAAGGYLGDIIPAHRRAEGMGYYGIATVMALAVAPALGLWIYSYGWQSVCLSAAALNLVMVVIAYRLPETGAPRLGPVTISLRGAIEWRVLMLSGTLFLYYFGYGGIASFAALYATANQVTPPGLYFSVFAASAMTTTLFAGPLGDRFGHARLLVPALVLITLAYALLGVSGTKWWLIVSAIIFGFGIPRCLPAVHRLRAAPGGTGTPRRGVRRHHRRAGHRRRHRLHHHGLDHRSLRLRPGLRHRRVHGRRVYPLFPGDERAAAPPSLGVDDRPHAGVGLEDV